MTSRYTPGGIGAGDVGMALLRVFAGGALALAHGMGKLPPSPGFVAAVAELGFPAASLFAWAAGLAEFVGGLLLAVGLLTRPAALFIAFTMMVAVLGRHAGDPFSDRELPLLFAFVALHFLLAGAGRLSVDAVLRRRSEQPPPAAIEPGRPIRGSGGAGRAPARRTGS